MSDLSDYLQTHPFAPSSASALPGSLPQLVYLSPTGDDLDPGTSDLPKQTLDDAVDSIYGFGNIVLLAGTYLGSDMILTSSKVKHLVISAEAGKKVTIRFGTPLTTFTQDSGIRWKAALDHAPDAALAYVFKLNEPEGLISSTERHPLHHGRTYRLPHKRLVKAASKADILNGNGRWWYESGFLYLSDTDGGNPNGDTFQVPEYDTSHCFINSGTAGHVEVNGINVEFAYRAFDLHLTQSYSIKSSTAYGSTDVGFFVFDSGFGTFSMCECAASSNDGIVIGSAYGTIASGISRTTNCHLNDIYCHDNYDKGVVAHERGTIFVYGGLYEHMTTESGLMAYRGGELTAIGALTRHNTYGLIVIADPGSVDEGGIGTIIRAVNCTSDSDTYSWWAQDSGNSIELKDCTSITPGGYPIWQADGGAVVIAKDCIFYLIDGSTLAIGTTPAVPLITNAIVVKSGTPEGQITAPVGTMCRTTNGAGVFYKTTGVGNTGWTAL